MSDEFGRLICCSVGGISKYVGGIRKYVGGD